ncbi:protein-methionine-sulfoxide reductase catalytic subunit MsrP [Catenovulum sp. 2E275]|uniref:protein-methionine-sulfoxide reductase catalytic subunit MsrP n=1 Tax=Catenovulum sp. 2E275 TaxID=2980497 RepID=UPI0021D16735|nr:protein-methionine-sulfoxide reductase catalytic subunit MsrP [Catenovulum sp. 2E275]MCU4676135.1 protein-methionine-sulfoxide reductase catalytic subunit MsrP [Catenovulum sp. 2E275]
MRIVKSNRSQFKDHQITDETVFNNKRHFLKKLGLVSTGALLTTPSQAGLFDWLKDDEAQPAKPPAPLKQLSYQPVKQSQKDQLELTPQDKVTSYNNFYEFGTAKQDPSEHAHQLTVDPWQLTVSGMVETPITLNYDDLFSSFALEERVYRLRCVEAWSMVIPWVGFSLADLLKKAGVKSDAKYVAFETLYRPNEMRGQKSRFIGGSIPYPYTEGLRIDEAMHPLTLLAIGLYGKSLPNQNGAPVRLVVPWKYGFKSIKSITSIKLTNRQPKTTWNISAPDEYGFYANVNPNVDHPRWSQASERIITSGGLFDQQRVKTLPFNGYADQVAALYKGMDLSKYY